MVNVRNDDPPYVNLEKFNGTEYSDSDADLMEALERSLTTEMLQHLPVVELTHHEEETDRENKLSWEGQP